MLGDGWLAGADIVDDVTPGCRPIRDQEADDLVARPIAEGRHGHFDV